ncbi:MAG: lysylphosphatidylglycerol synthase transmembrane domain-containing protein [Nitrospinaceae bacterium]
MTKSILKFIFLSLGFLFFVLAVQAVDLEYVGRLLIQMGVGIIGLIAFNALINWIDAVSWKYAFPAAGPAPLNSGGLWRIRIIGEAFNIITPLGTLGGEPLKAQLLKERYGLSLKQGLASQIVARTTLLIGQILFMIPGVVLLILSPVAAPDFKNITATFLVVFSVLIALFLLFQITGILGKLTGWVEKWIPRWAEADFLSQLKRLDSLMSDYYRHHPRRFLGSVGYAFTGWLLGVVELYLTLYFLGFPLDFTELWIIEAVIQLIRVCSFYIPLSLGAQEGGLVLTFISLGMRGDLGLAVSFVRRIRELFWVAAGLILGGGMQLKSSPVQAENTES